jgi:DNA polymerase III alpha subunit
MYNNNMSTFLADEQTGIELLYRQKPIHDVPFVDSIVDQFNQHAVDLELEPISSTQIISKEFNIPQHYKDIDIEDYIKRLIPQGGDSDLSVKARVEEELALYKARNLYPILQLMIYIIDTMRKNDLVWGIGRGSCVSSYLLYLIGVHKVDSVKYSLNIQEFLK